MTTIIKNIFSILDPVEKKRFRRLAVMDILVSVLDILSLVFLLWIIRFYVEPESQDQGFLPAWLADNDSIAIIGVYFVFFSIKNLFAFIVARLQLGFSGDVAVRISRQNLVRYQQSDFMDYVNVDSSAQVRKIGFEPFEFSQYMLTGMQQLITQSFLVVLTIAAIIWFNASVFLLLLVILLPPVAIVFFSVKKRLAATRQDIRDSNEISYRFMMDALKGFVESNIYGRNRFFEERFARQRKRFSDALFHSLGIQAMPSRLIEIFAILGLFVLIAIAKWWNAGDSSLLLIIAAFVAAAYKIIPGLVKIINISGQMRAYEYTLTDLQNTHELQERRDLQTEKIHSIEFRSVGFYYGDLPVIKNFNLSAGEGDFIGIRGRSGKGKTTLMNLLLGFVNAQEGGILINGRSVKDTNTRQFWNSISYVRQQSFFIHDSILKNITLEDEGYDEKRLSCALQASGLDEMIAKYPEGIHKIITENGKNISGGQQQRISIARAMYREADLYLLDEPFNELDETSVNHIIGYFHRLTQSGKMVVMITHDQKTLAYCNKILNLDEE